MNYLFRYLQSINGSERSRLAELRLTSREQQTFSWLLAASTERLTAESHTKDEALGALEMSSGLFDKICSKLLRCILERLTEPGFTRYKHLVEHRQYDLLLHEMKRDAKLASSLQERAQQAADAFLAYHLRYGKGYSAAQAEAFAKGYRQYFPCEATEIIIEASMLRLLTWDEASRRSSIKLEEEIRDRLERNQRRLEAAGEPRRPKYYQLKAWSNYYAQLKRDPERRSQLLLELSQLCENDHQLFTVAERLQARLEIAEDEYYYRRGHHQALSSYRAIFNEYHGELDFEYYHRCKLVQLEMIAGSMQEAERILRKLEELSAPSNSGLEKREITGLFEATLAPTLDTYLFWAKLFLMTDRHQAADSVLQMFSTQSRSPFLQFEIEHRILETAAFYLRGDIELTETRISSNIKFLRARGFTLKASRYYPWFFKLLQAFIDEQTIGAPLSPKLELKLDDFMEGPAAQYGILLKRLRAVRVAP